MAKLNVITLNRNHHSALNNGLGRHWEAIKKFALIMRDGSMYHVDMAVFVTRSHCEHGYLFYMQKDLEILEGHL